MPWDDSPDYGGPAPNWREAAFFILAVVTAIAAVVIFKLWN